VILASAVLRWTRVLKQTHESLIPNP
jgi:hypothetical protein